MKDKISDQYNQILERLELKVKDDGTIESVEKNGYIIKNKYFLNNVNNILVINTYLIHKVIKDILNNYNVTYYEYKNNEIR